MALGVISLYAVLLAEFGNCLIKFVCYSSEAIASRLQWLFRDFFNQGYFSLIRNMVT